MSGITFEDSGGLANGWDLAGNNFMEGRVTLNQVPRFHHVLDPVTVPVIALPIRTATSVNFGSNNDGTLILQPRTVTMERRIVQPQEITSHPFQQSFTTNQNLGNSSFDLGPLIGPQLSSNGGKITLMITEPWSNFCIAPSLITLNNVNTNEVTFAQNSDNSEGLVNQQTYSQVQNNEADVSRSQLWLPGMTTKKQFQVSQSSISQDQGSDEADILVASVGSPFWNDSPYSSLSSPCPSHQSFFESSHSSRTAIRLSKADSEDFDVDFEQIVDDVDNLYNEQLTMVQPASPLQSQPQGIDQFPHHQINSTLLDSHHHHHQQQQTQQQVQLLQPMAPQQHLKLIQQPQVQLLQSVSPQHQLKIVQQSPGSQIQQLKLVQQVRPMMPPQSQIQLVQHPAHQLLQQCAPQQQVKLVQQQQQVQVSVQPMSSSQQQLGLVDSQQETLTNPVNLQQGEGRPNSKPTIEFPSSPKPSSTETDSLEVELSKFTSDFYRKGDEVCYGGFRVHKDFMRTDEDFMVVSENPEVELEEFLAGEERWRGSDHICSRTCGEAMKRLHRKRKMSKPQRKKCPAVAKKDEERSRRNSIGILVSSLRKKVYHCRCIDCQEKRRLEGKPEPEEPIQIEEINFTSDDIEPDMIPVPQKKGRGRPRKYLRLEDVIQWRKQREVNQNDSAIKTANEESGSRVQENVQRDKFDQLTMQDLQRVESVLPQQILEDQQPFQGQIENEEMRKAASDQETTQHQLSHEVDPLSTERLIEKISITLERDYFQGIQSHLDLDNILHGSQLSPESGPKQGQITAKPHFIKDDYFEIKRLLDPDHESEIPKLVPDNWCLTPEYLPTPSSENIREIEVSESNESQLKDITFESHLVNENFVTTKSNPDKDSRTESNSGSLVGQQNLPSQDPKSDSYDSQNDISMSKMTCSLDTSQITKLEIESSGKIASESSSQRFMTVKQDNALFDITPKEEEDYEVKKEEPVDFLDNMASSCDSWMEDEKIASKDGEKEIEIVSEKIGVPNRRFIYPRGSFMTHFVDPRLMLARPYPCCMTTRVVCPSMFSCCCMMSLLPRPMESDPPQPCGNPSGYVSKIDAKAVRDALAVVSKATLQHQNLLQTGPKRKNRKPNKLNQSKPKPHDTANVKETNKIAPALEVEQETNS